MKQTSGVTKEQVQKVIEEIEKLIDLNSEYENKPRSAYEHPNMHVGNSLRASRNRLMECLEDCLS
jgi:hypothetical protein